MYNFGRTVNQVVIPELSEQIILNTVAEAEKDFKDKQASKLRGLKKIYKIFETIIDENSSDASFVIAMLSSTSQGMGHFVSTSAPIKFYSKYLEGGIVEEHTMPASLVAKYLFSSAINKTIDKDFKDIERNYFQGALGKFDDKKLKGKKPDLILK